MQIIDNLSIFQALVFILTNESIIKQKRNITRTTLIKYVGLEIQDCCQIHFSKQKGLEVVIETIEYHKFFLQSKICVSKTPMTIYRGFSACNGL